MRINFNNADNDDLKELEELNVEQWQIDLLKLNPEYTMWGNYEDYMIKKGSDWDVSCDFESIQDGGLFELDDYNECVNFYFEVIRPSKTCDICNGSGCSLEAKKIYDSFGQDVCRAYVKTKKICKDSNIDFDCRNCKGKGYLYISDNAHVGLQLWYLHPRKGCSRGVYIKNIEQCDIPEIITFLKKANTRNNLRFCKVLNYECIEQREEAENE